MSSKRHADVLVVGGGIVGLCVAWAAAASGSVTLLERVRLGHDRGSSNGDARMRVPAGYPDDEYLERGIAAGDDWLAVGRAYGRPLLYPTGCLSWGTGQEDLRRGLSRYGLPHDVWTQRDVDRAYPGIRLPPGVAAIHQPDGAIIQADWAVDAFAAQARRRGAVIAEGVAVTAIRPSDHDVRVETSAGAWSAGHVVICAGPWTQSLLAGAGIPVPVTTTSQTVCFFEFSARPPPGLIEYGDPDPYALYSRGHGIKAALHAPGPPAGPDDRPPPDAEAVRRTAQWVTKRFGGQVTGRPVRIQTCLYTTTADERFLLRQHGRVLVVAACSGHGFQYAPDTGRRAAALLRG
jgi:glycine/D-amino acid oxidase-like deaminating enzyme